MVAPFLQHFRVFLKQQDRLQNQIIKIHRVIRFNLTGVLGIDAGGNRLIGQTAFAQRLMRQHKLVFPPADLPTVLVHLLHIVHLWAVLDKLLQQQLAVMLVKNRNGRLEA